MALSFGRRKPRGGHGGRCRHFHVHYHLPRKRAGTFSLLRWLPRPSLLSCVLTPLALFFAVLAFVVSFVWYTLLYFVAFLFNKDSHHESLKSGSFGRASGDNHPREAGGGEEVKRQAKGKKDVNHATELLTGDSAGVRKLEIKEVHIDGFSQVSQNTTRIAEVRSTCNDRVVEKPSIFETGREGKHADSDLEGISGRQVDGFVDEHNNIKLVSRSTPGDSFPSTCSINSVQVHDLPDMNEVIEISSDFLAGSNQNMVVPSNTPSPPRSSDTNEEFFEDRKELPDCTPYEIINFIDKHERRDQPLDETIGLLTSSDGSAHGTIPGEHADSTEEKDAECVPESLTDCVPNLEHFDEQRVPGVPIIEANAKKSADEVHDFSNEDEQVEAIGNNGVGASDPASAACDFVWNHQTATRALDDSVNGNVAGAVASRESSEDEADDNSSSEGAPRGRPPLRRSPSQWWNLCGVVDVFAGSDD
uniref:Uncharacterized protein n=1 Tax=Avena sativa TaxID=4498 RepID=A0ACD5TQ42_AVESA